MVSNTINNCFNGNSNNTIQNKYTLTHLHLTVCEETVDSVEIPFPTLRQHIFPPTDDGFTDIVLSAYTGRKKWVPTSSLLIYYWKLVEYITFYERTNNCETVVFESDDAKRIWRGTENIKQIFLLIKFICLHLYRLRKWGHLR